MNSLSISGKLQVLVALSVLTVVAIIGLGAIRFAEIQEIREQRIDAEQVGRSALILEAKANAMNVAGGALKDSKDPASEAQFTNAAEQAHAQLDIVPAGPVKDTLSSALDDAETAFSEAYAINETLGFTPDAGQRQTLNAASTALEEALGKLVFASIGVKLEFANQMTEKLLQLQKAEQAYQLGGEAAVLLEKVSSLEAAYKDLVGQAPMLDDDKANFNALMDGYAGEIRGFAEVNEAALASASTLGGALERIGQAATDLRGEAEAAWTAAEVAEEDAFVGLATFVLVIGAIGAGLAAILGTSLGRSISGLIKTLSETLHNLAQDRHTGPIPFLERTDEIGQISRAIEALRLETDQAFLLRQTVEGHKSSTVLVSPEMEILYLNAACKELLAKFGDDLPLSPDAMVGQSLDMLHKDGASLRRAVAANQAGAERFVLFKAMTNKAFNL
ncbi:MAG: hypothetical protein ACPGYL_06270 [Rhodospirillaceae bacterium]